jgi:CYTH domain-containing protein
MYMQAAYEMPDEKILIVCDRGIPDGKAYLNDADYKRMMGMLHTDEVTMRDKYDAVFSLVTAANGAEEFYTLANNSARTETAEQAREKDNAIISAWTGHPHFRVIDNSTDFHGKMMRLISEISSFLGEPEPYEIERKFLIQYPDMSKLENMPNCKRIEIMQTYLNAPEGDEVRVRQRGADGHFVYIKTTKRRVSNVKRLEIEKRISQDEYLRLLMDADITKHSIRKTRYCLTWNNQYFEIDVYPFDKKHAIVEIELTSEDDTIEFPDFLRVICEVTNNDAYKNASLAETLTFDMTGID